MNQKFVRLVQKNQFDKINQSANELVDKYKELNKDLSNIKSDFQNLLQTLALVPSKDSLITLFNIVNTYNYDLSIDKRKLASQIASSYDSEILKNVIKTNSNSSNLMALLIFVLLPKKFFYEENVRNKRGYGTEES